ncbi:unnamed protein product, partial [Rotaria magnacalcarata]
MRPSKSDAIARPAGDNTVSRA